MPAWLHQRAEHIRRKNPSMPKSEAFAIATNQSHATGHTPSGYGTAEGKRKAQAKYDKPQSEYVQTADPSGKSKSSGIDVDLLKGFSDELEKIALVPTAPTTAATTIRASRLTGPAPMGPTRPGAVSRPKMEAPGTRASMTNTLPPPIA